MEDKLQIQILPGGKAPTRANEHAVGYDLYAASGAILEPGLDVRPHSTFETYVTPSGGCVKVPCGFAMTPPKGYFGLIKGRSGLAVNSSIDVMAGVIDPDYTGEIQVALINHGTQVYHIKKGDRIAQLLLLPYGSAEIAIVEDLTSTERGTGGFGSTGQ